MSHLDLDHQSDCLFSQIPLHSAIRNYGGHAQWAIKMTRILQNNTIQYNTNFIYSRKSNKLTLAMYSY